MKMNKMFAGLIAFVAGVALSAGSAFAENMGYMVGDAANMKLVPYYETGDMKATIIGIQNMSPQELSTMAFNQDVSDLEAYLGGQTLTGTQETNLEAAPVSLDEDDVVTNAGGLNRTNFATNYESVVSRVEAALEAAKERVYTEHVFVTVNAYDAMGVMMDDASATLCLAEGQFGVVVLQGAASMGGNGHMMQTLSVADGDIDEYGYVEIMSGTRKYTGCVATTPDGLSRVDNDTNPNNTTILPTNNSVASWAIIQDTGDGFFGTEVPSATISKEQNAGASTDVTTDDGDPELACYNNSNNVGDRNTAAANITPNTSGTFQTDRCGLIPERNFIALQGTADPNRTVNLASTNTTVSATATARYDAGDDSTVYVWLAKGMDTETTKPSQRRKLLVTVVCEDGSKQTAADQDGNPGPIEVPAPGMVTMIDPIGDALSDYTDQCEGDRGVLEITMPNNSHAGMVFSHVQQMMGHYRMNFPGYSMAVDGFMDDGTTVEPLERCTATPTDSCR